jgi:parallel beta-helix repeat protein
MDKRYAILIVSITIFVLGFVGTASASTWSVDVSGGADFTGIQEAINNASVGDTIIVYSGVYYENVVVNKSVTLKGIGHPVVDANGSGSTITLNADGITLVGFNATNSGSPWRIEAGIKVTSNNNSITGNNVSNNWYGIRLSYSRNNNSITGNNVSNNLDGIRLSYSSNNNSITGNNVSNNLDGIILQNSHNNTITGNTLVNDGLIVSYSYQNTVEDNTLVNDGLTVSYSYQNTVEDNTVNGNPLIYLEDASDYIVEDAGQVILVNCTNITVKNQDLSNTSTGIKLWETKDSIISNNTASNNWVGITLSYSSNNNTITGNNVSNNNEAGIVLCYSCNNNTITGNNASNNNWGAGITLRNSHNNSITGNNVSNNNNWAGITLRNSHNNSITGNNVSNNTYDGISLISSSSNNSITGNNVSNNNGDGISLSYSGNLSQQLHKQHR